MNFEIIKNHSKLFLFQIIEHGMKQNLIDEHFFNSNDKAGCRDVLCLCQKILYHRL